MMSYYDPKFVVLTLQTLVYRIIMHLACHSLRLPNRHVYGSFDNE